VEDIQMKMTIDEFFGYLATTNGWSLHRDKIRIYANRESGIPTERHCPITAVCHKLTGKRFHPNDYSKAAASIGMGPWTATLITLGADNSPIPSDELHRDLSDEVSLIRQRLFHVLELSDQSSTTTHPTHQQEKAVHETAV